MNDAKSILIKLIWVYVVIVAGVAVIGAFVALVSRLASDDGGGFPIALVPLITMGTALVLLGIFVSIGIGIVVYHDAKRRDMEPVLWALVAALVPYFLGLIAYLIARKPSSVFCSECGGAMVERSAFCPHCGHSIQKTCPQCGRSADPASRFCPHCGTQVERGEESSPPLAPPGQDG